MTKDEKKPKLQYIATTANWQPKYPPKIASPLREPPPKMNSHYNLGYYYRPPLAHGRIVEVSESEHEYAQSYHRPADSSSDDSTSGEEEEEKAPNVFRFLQSPSGAQQALVPVKRGDFSPPLPYPPPYPPNAFGQPPLPLPPIPSPQQPVAFHFCVKCKRARSPEYHRTHPFQPVVKPRLGVCRRCKRKNKVTAEEKEKHSVQRNVEENRSTEREMRTQLVEHEIVDDAARRIRVEVKDDEGARKRYTVQRVSRSMSPLPKSTKQPSTGPRTSSPTRNKTVIHIQKKCSELSTSRPPAVPKPRKPPPKAPSSALSSSQNSSPPKPKDAQLEYLSLAERTPLPESIPSTKPTVSVSSPKSEKPVRRTRSFRHVPAGFVSGTIRTPNIPPAATRTARGTTHSITFIRYGSSQAAAGAEQFPPISQTTPSSSASTALVQHRSSSASSKASREDGEIRRHGFKRTIRGKPAAVAEYQAKLKSYETSDQKALLKGSDAKPERRNEGFSEKEQADIRDIAKHYYESRKAIEQRGPSRPDFVSVGRLVSDVTLSHTTSSSSATSQTAERERRKAPPPKQEPLIIEVQRPPPHVIHVPHDATQEEIDKIVRRVTGLEVKESRATRSKAPASSPPIPNKPSASSTSSIQPAPKVEVKEHHSKRRVVYEQTPSITSSSVSVVSSPKVAAGDAAGPYRPLPHGRARLYNEDGSMVAHASTSRNDLPQVNDDAQIQDSDSRPRLRNEDGTPAAGDVALRQRQRNRDAPKPPGQGPPLRSAPETAHRSPPVTEIYYHERVERRGKSVSRSPEPPTRRPVSQYDDAPKTPRSATYYKRRIEQQRRNVSPTSSFATRSRSPRSPQSELEGISDTVRRAGRSLKRALTLTPRLRSAMRDTSRRRHQRCSSSEEVYRDGVLASQGRRSSPMRNPSASGTPQSKRASMDQESLAVHVGDAQHAHFEAKIIEREEVRGRGNGRDHERYTNGEDEEEVVRRQATMRREGDGGLNWRRGREIGRQGEIEKMGWSRPSRVDGAENGNRGQDAQRGRSRSPYFDDDLITARAQTRNGTVAGVRGRVSRRIGDELDNDQRGRR